MAYLNYKIIFNSVVPPRRSKKRRVPLNIFVQIFNEHLHTACKMFVLSYIVAF